MHGTLTVVDEIDTLTDDEQRAIPAWWRQLVTADASSAVQITVEHWRKALPSQLPRFLQVLASEGIDVALVRASSDLYSGLGLVQDSSLDIRRLQISRRQRRIFR